MELFRLYGSVFMETDAAMRALALLTNHAESIASRISVLGQRMAGFGATLTAAVSAPIGAVVGMGVKYNATMQDLNTSFKVMLGSKEKADKMSADLIKMGAETPFESTQLADYTKMLLSFGYTSENVLPIMSRLGDVSLGNGEKMSSLTRTMGQINSLGKLQGGDLNQLIGQGWNPLNAIIAKTGESMADVRKRMEAGNVTYAEVEEALISVTSEGGLFYKGMAEGAQTFNGQLSTLSDTFNMFVGNLTKPIFDKLSEWLPLLIEKLGVLSTMFTNLSPNTQLWILGIMGVAAAVGPVILAIGTLLIAIGAIIPVVTAISGYLVTLNPIVLVVVAAFGALVAAAIGVAYAWTEVKSRMLGAWDEIYANHKSSIDALVALVSSAWNYVKLNFEATWALIKVAAGVAWSAIRTVFEVAWTGIKMWVDAALLVFQGDYLGAWGRIKEGTAVAWEQIKVAIKAAWDSISAWWRTSSPLFADLFKNLWQGIITYVPVAWGLLKDAIKVAWDVIVALFSGGEPRTAFGAAMQVIWADIQAQIPVVWTAIQEALMAVWASICTWYSTGGKEQILSVLAGVNDAIGSAINAAWDGIKAAIIAAISAINDDVGSAFSSLASSAVQYGRDVIQGFVNGISEKAQSVRDVVSNIATSATNAFKSVLGIQSPSRVFRKLGVEVVEGLTNGFTESESKAVDAMNKLGGAIETALKTKLTMRYNVNKQALDKEFAAYEKGYPAQTKLLDKEYEKQKKSAESATTYKIKLINTELAAKLKTLDVETRNSVKALESQIDGIDAVTAAEDARQKELDFAKQKQELEDKRFLAKTGEEKFQAEQELARLIADHNRWFQLQQREYEKDALQRQITAIQEKAVLEAERLEKEAEEKILRYENELVQDLAFYDSRYEQQKTALEKELIATKAAYEHKLGVLTQSFEQQTTAQALQNQTLQALQNKSMDDLIILLETYYPDWETAGRSFGENLLDGIESKEQEIRTAVDALMQLVQKSGVQMGFSVPKYEQGTNYVPSDGLAYLHRGEAVVPAKYNMPSRANASRNSITLNINAQTNDPDKLGNILVGRLKQLGVV